MADQGAHDDMARAEQPGGTWLTDAKAIIILVVCGFDAFLTGLFNGFIGDDSLQIVQATPVHSFSNVFSFFREGTFYIGQGNSLTGIYYRPLQTTVFSLLYSVFGETPFYFHAFQIGLCLANAAILFLVLRHWFKPLLSLVLSLVFLLHPIDSQAAFQIPYTQDALFFFFGILALWLVLRSQSVPMLAATVGCLFLSLMTKETGILFVAVVFLYLVWFEWKRLLVFIGLVAAPIAAWLALRINAVGLINTPKSAPIALLNLGERLMTVPAILLQYLKNLIWPVQLASGYYWTHPTYSVADVGIPLAIDLVVVAGLVYLGWLVHKAGTRRQFRSYLFFGSWCAIGLLAHLQIIPLELTVTEVWFYFSMAGLLGMSGIVVATVIAPRFRFDSRVVMAIVFAVLLALGLRTEARGLDFSSDQTLASIDIQVADNYASEAVLAHTLVGQGDFQDAKGHALHSISLFPYFTGYEALASACHGLRDYACTMQALVDASAPQGNSIEGMVDQAGAWMMFAGNPDANVKYLVTAIGKWPQDAGLWENLAVVLYKRGDVAKAKEAITQAYALSPSTEISQIYAVIQQGGELNLQPGA